LALVAPVRDVVVPGSDNPCGVFCGSVFNGYWLALLGWLGPIGYAPGWFANISFFICLIRLFRGRAPGNILLVLTAAIALTVVLPHAIPDPEGDDTVWSHFRGAAVWLWLCSCLTLSIFGLVLWRNVSEGARQGSKAVAA
jgi:hypothetical protein